MWDIVSETVHWIVDIGVILSVIVIIKRGV